MKRLVIIAAALLIALATPAQVWCQATCAAPRHARSKSALTPHCPSHEESAGGSVSNAHQDQCRAPESSRSANPVRTFALSAGAGILAQVCDAIHIQPLAASWAPPVASVQTPAFNYPTPLRI